MKLKAQQIVGLIIIFLALCSVQKSDAQLHGVNDTIKVGVWISPEGDTIPMGYMYPVQVYTKMPDRWKKYWAEWTRLRNAVYVTYPYAKAASKIMNEINAQLVGVTDKAQRKAIIKAREKDLRKEFTSKLTQLSVYQGRVLMKLIYRETGNNCYEIIEEYKGGFTAGFYQSVAFVFGTSLKQNYDPADKDKAMEIIVRDVARMYGYRS
ncbi:DUF4294 domain-containing protein [Chitinophagaceae bacterium LWZ2-11]